jgi:hypothetical protein
MPITLKDKMRGLSPTQRKKVEARAAALIAKEMTLLRKSVEAKADKAKTGNSRASP